MYLVSGSGTMNLVLCISLNVSGLHTLQEGDESRLRYYVSGTTYLVLCIWYYVSGTMYLVLCIWYYVSGTMYLVLYIYYYVSN